MSIFNWDKPKLDTFDQSAVDRGGLGEAVVKVAAGESIPAAVIESITGATSMDDPTNTKPAIASKVNGIGALVTALGGALIPVMLDPGVQQAVSNVETMLPASWIPWITMALGIGTVVARTFFTSKPIAGVVKQQ